MSSQSDQAPNLPYSDELNPLMNPLLSENMGRWADVYFNNPPEQREKAVLSLVHELQEEKNHREEKATAAPSNAEEIRVLKNDSSSDERGVMPSGSDVVRCEGCGYENPHWNKFCGMCGATINTDKRDSTPAEAHDEKDGEQMRQETHVTSSDTGESDAAREVKADPEPFENSISNPNELSLFRSFRGADSSAYEDYEPQSHFRLYLGIVLVLVILGLGYMGWKNGLFSVQSSQETLPPASSATKPAETAPVKANPPAATAPANNEDAATPEKKAEAPLPTPATKDIAKKVPGKASAIPKTAQPQATADHGNQELTTAESFLNGTGGQTRNSAVAAQWLWKSIAKHNGPASVLLADLYLKGDGVSKNCDQARVLLDSAAMKGVPGAGTRLRNLQAFGCQ